MGRPLMGPRRVGYVGGRVGGGSAGCVAAFIIGFMVVVAIIITVVVVFAVDAQCPSNVQKCPECTSWVNTTFDHANHTNSSHWHIEEICWEKFSWSNLTKREQMLWQDLGQSQPAWDRDAENARALNLCWKELDATELAAATALGYRRETWNCAFHCSLVVR